MYSEKYCNYPCNAVSVNLAGAPPTFKPRPGYLTSMGQFAYFKNGNNGAVDSAYLPDYML